ncbi:hypothetical protein AALA36_17805 [Lachnospiraceae bacterium 66-29]
MSDRINIWRLRMSKKDYFARSCIYNRVCVVGKKETVYRLVEELREMQTVIQDVAEQLREENATLTNEGLQEMQTDFTNMLQAILWMLDGARYLWEGTNTCKKKSEAPPDESVDSATEIRQE